MISSSSSSFAAYIENNNNIQMKIYRHGIIVFTKSSRWLKKYNDNRNPCMHTRTHMYTIYLFVRSKHLCPFQDKTFPVHIRISKIFRQLLRSLLEKPLAKWSHWYKAIFDIAYSTYEDNYIYYLSMILLLIRIFILCYFDPIRKLSGNS